MFNPEEYVKWAKQQRKRACLVMVTFNRWKLTYLSLLSVFTNTYMPYVLTVVDNASWDGTREKLKHFRRTKKIHKLVLLPKNVGIGKGKNYGLKAWEDKADWYACIDNDIQVSPYWLAYLCYASTLKNLGVVGANVQGFGTKYKWFQPTLWKEVNGIFLDTCPNPGGIYVMSRKTFNTLGYFRQWSLYGLEDSELWLRQVQHGLRSAYVRNVNCVELKDENFKMKNGKDYRTFKTETHNNIAAVIQKLKKQGKYRQIKQLKTKITLQEIEKYSWPPK